MPLDLQTKYDELINSLPDGIIIIDSIGQILLSNSAAAEILGFGSAEALCGLGADQLYANAGDHDSLLSILGHRGYADKSLFDWRRKNGTTVLVEVSALPLRDHLGHIRGIQMIFRDITGKLKTQIAQQETIAETAARAIDEDKFLDAINTYRSAPMSLILQGVAHNLNTPLGGIRGRAELLLHQMKKNAGLVERVQGDVKPEIEAFHSKMDKGISEIIAQVDKATALIRGFANKIANELYEGEIEIEVNTLIQNELSFLESSLYFKHQIQKNVSLGENLPIVKGVYRNYSQALYNIFINSMKATTGVPEKKINVRTYQNDQAIIIEISDNRPSVQSGEAGYHLAVHLDSKYESVPDEARFSRYDIELASALRMLSLENAQLNVFPNNEPRFVITIPK